MELVKCPFCGKEIENDGFFCDQCGEELKLCSTHGFKKGKVCNECGTKLVEAKTAQAGNTATPTPNPPQTQQVQQPQATPVQVTEARPAITTQAVTPPADIAEKTVRPTAAPAEPQQLVSAALNARLNLKNGAVIGRRAGDYTQVFSAQGYVSGTHARVQKNAAGVWEIVDLDSSNGTFLNGQKLVANQPVAFKIGDTIAFYDLKFTVE
ncbi:hypothetical protein FACS189434_10640 [Bacteroidia bacterium]|nr:hypothetical protein FACS189434_10640 [Bacteroidia bacterium]